jgi:hypothetical protein
MDLQEVECGAWTKLIWLRKGTVAGTCEPSGCIKYGEFLD